MLHFLMHGKKDNVAVAVANVKAGENCICLNMEDQQKSEINTLMDIPLGHKVALQDMQVDDTIIKYDHDIGKVVAPIKKGEHVHVQRIGFTFWHLMSH